MQVSLRYGHNNPPACLSQLAVHPKTNYILPWKVALTKHYEVPLVQGYQHAVKAHSLMRTPAGHCPRALDNKYESYKHHMQTYGQNIKHSIDAIPFTILQIEFINFATFLKVFLHNADLIYKGFDVLYTKLSFVRYTVNSVLPS
jgi:hypothetical protein